MRHSAEARTAFWLEPDKRAWGSLGQDLTQSRHEGGYDGLFLLDQGQSYADDLASLCVLKRE